MKPSAIRAIVTSSFILLVFALAGCGKTGALYLPDADLAAAETSASTIK